MAVYTADWSSLGSVYYRKIELYSMGWSEQVNLADYMIAAAQFGGPIALIKDDKKIQKVRLSARPNIYIFSSSGQCPSTIKWNSGKLIHMGWSSSEDLLCIQDDGTVLVYDLFGSLQRSFCMGQEAKDTKVLECKVFTSYKQVTGIAVLTGAYRVFLVNNVMDPRVRRSAEVPGLNAPPSSWAVIRENYETQVLIAKDAELFALDQNEGKCQSVYPEFSSSVNAITEMAISFNHKHIALFTDTGVLWMGSSDLQRRYCEFDTKCPSRPHQLVWCGNGAVVGIWQNNLLVVGIHKDFLNYSYYNTPIHLVPEIDGVRIIGNATHELLQKVPDVVSDILRIGSVSPGALLFEALKEFQRRSHKADDYMRIIQERNELHLAVERCIQAAGHEFQPGTQKTLLRAASFGKCFIPDMKPDSFYEMCQKLRVLNAMRVYMIGLPLTYDQLQFLTVLTLLDRLVLRRHYCLVIRICQYLKIPDSVGASRILAQWACYKVNQTNVDEDQLAWEIANKLGNTAGISYSQIASKAVECGRKRLAVKLLDYEPQASDQVPLLIKLKQECQAMSKAIDSGDTDLVYLVILHLRDNLSPRESNLTIRKFPVAYSLFLKLCKEQNLELLRDMYYQEDDFGAEADCRVIESYQTTRVDRRISCLQAALDSYRKAKNEFSITHTEEQLRLIKYQEKLEDRLNHTFLDLSLHQTMQKLLSEREYKLAEDLRKEFKVPDRRFWWLKISVLSEAGEWLELDKFSKSKKSPIGYEPFVDACLKYNAKLEAQKYLPKVKDENKVKYYIKVGMLEEAAKVAFEQKDEAALVDIQNRCGIMNRTLADKITTMKTQLGSRR